MRRRQYSAQPDEARQSLASATGDGPFLVQAGEGIGYLVSEDRSNMFAAMYTGSFTSGDGMRPLPLNALALDQPTDADAIVQRLTPQESVDNPVSKPTLRRLRSNT